MVRHAFLVGLVFVAAATVAHPAVAQEDRGGCEDHPMSNRLEAFYMVGCEEEGFGGYELMTPDGREPVEGHFISITYRRPHTKPEMSGLEMIGNHTQAIGGEVIYDGRWMDRHHRGSASFWGGKRCS